MSGRITGQTSSVAAVSCWLSPLRQVCSSLISVTWQNHLLRGVTWSWTLQLAGFAERRVLSMAHEQKKLKPARVGASDNLTHRDSPKGSERRDGSQTGACRRGWYTEHRHTLMRTANKENVLSKHFSLISDPQKAVVSGHNIHFSPLAWSAFARMLVTSAKTWTSELSSSGEFQRHFLSAIVFEARWIFPFHSAAAYARPLVSTYTYAAVLRVLGFSNFQCAPMNVPQARCLQWVFRWKNK